MLHLYESESGLKEMVSLLIDEEAGNQDLQLRAVVLGRSKLQPTWGGSQRSDEPLLMVEFIFKCTSSTPFTVIFHTLQVDRSLEEYLAI